VQTAWYGISVTGTLPTTTTTKTYWFPSGAGPVTGTVTFTGAASLTLRLKAATGTTLLSKSGASPVWLGAWVQTAWYGISVTGSKATYSLKITRPKP
jgi:hypothetical protein